VFARDSRNGVIWNRETFRSLRKFVREKAIDVVILDPAVKMHRLPESDNGKMDDLFTKFADFAHEENIAIEIAFHPKKLDDKDTVSMEDLRGAIAQISAIRSLRTMRIMSLGEANKYGLLEKDKYKWFVCVDNGGANMLAPGRSHEKWLRRVSVEITAYKGQTPVIESVGALETCAPPWANAEGDSESSPIVEMANAPLEELTEEDLALLSLITDRIAKLKPVTYGRISPNSPPKLFTIGVQGGKQKKRRFSEIEEGVERLIAHGKLHIDIDTVMHRTNLCLGPRVAPVVRDPNAPPRSTPWTRKATEQS
jgi:hypothetical protein